MKLTLRVWVGLVVLLTQGGQGWHHCSLQTKDEEDRRLRAAFYNQAVKKGNMFMRINQAHYDAILQTTGEEMKSLYGVINKILPASWNTRVTTTETFSENAKLFFFLLKRCENNRLNWLTDQRVALKRHFGQGQLLNKAAHWRTIKNTMRLRQHRPRRLLGCFVSCNKSLTCRSHQLSTKTPTEKKSIILIWSQNNVQILFISFQIVSAYLYCFLSWIWK